MIHYYKANCHADNLKLIREFVKIVLHNLHLPEMYANQMVLAVDEVCTNIIFHSASNNPDKTLDINIVEETDVLEFQITDYYSNQFNSIQALQTRTTLQNIIAERRKGGIGLMLVRTIMDEIEVSHEGCQSVWRLRKNLRNVPQNEVQRS